MRKKAKRKTINKAGGQPFRKLILADSFVNTKIEIMIMDTDLQPVTWPRLITINEGKAKSFIDPITPEVAMAVRYILKTVTHMPIPPLFITGSHNQKYQLCAGESADPQAVKWLLRDIGSACIRDKHYTDLNTYKLSVSRRLKIPLSLVNEIVLAYAISSYIVDTVMKLNAEAA